MCFKYKYKNERLLNITKWRKQEYLLLRNCLKPNRGNKNHKSNLHPQPPKGKHFKFLQLKKKKERTENSSHKKGEINHTCWENSEDALNVHLRKPSEEHSQKTDGSKLNNVGNTEEEHTKLTLRSSCCQASLTHSTPAVWMWRTHPQVHIYESKNRSLQQSEVGVWAIGRAYLPWSFKTQGRQGWVRNQRQCLLAAYCWRSRENRDWTVSRSTDNFLGLDELKLKELFTQPVSYWEFQLFWLWPLLPEDCL